MPAPDPGRAARTLAAAAAFALALVLGLSASGLLAIVGAPLRLVAAVAPLGALLAGAALGFFLVAETLPEFLAAGRRVAASVSGLAFGVALAATALALGAPADQAALAPLAAGAALLAFVIAPKLHGFGGLSDVLATRFRHWSLRPAYAMVFFAVGGLTTMAAARVAESALAAAIPAPATVLDVAFGAALATPLALGGAIAVGWLDAACGASLLVAAAGLAGARAVHGGAEGLIEPLQALRTASESGAMAGAPLAAAVAGFAPLALGFGASGSTPQAVKIGGVGLAAFAIFALALALAKDALAQGGGAAAAAGGALALLFALALARRGVFVALRGFGLDMAVAASATANLASLRLAQARLGAVALAGAFVAGARAIQAPAGAMLLCALALSLALVLPGLLLALFTRGGSSAGWAALLAGAANFARIGHFPVSPGDFSLDLAAQGAAMALGLGGLVAFAVPREAGGPSQAFDAFWD